MIEYVMLIMLGFFVAGLIALLLAPTLWRRAVRLTTRRIEATMPMSLADIEADKDLLRATYAIQIRRLETAVEKAREKSAGQLVEISKLQMEIGGLKDQMTALQRLLDERGNAANVFEKTIKKRFPELDAQLRAARAALDERGVETTDLRNKLARKEETVTLAQYASALQQNEIRLLREALEKSGADNTGRFKKRPAQWTLEEYRSEYDRLNLELSKIREQVALSHERESHQAVVLKTEMQQLAERIMSTVAAQEKQSSTGGKDDAAHSTGSVHETVHRPQKSASAERALAAPLPWPKEQISQSEEQFPQKDPISPLSSQKLQAGNEPSTSSAQPVQDETFGRYELTKSAANMKAGGGLTESFTTSVTENFTTSVRDASSTSPSSSLRHEAKPATGKVFTRASIHAPAIKHDDEAPAPKTETRAALKSLLDRSPRSVPKGDAETGMPSFASLFGVTETAEVRTGAYVPAGPDGIPAGVTLASLMQQSAVPAAEAPAPVAENAPQAGGQETQMDRMLHEIFESRGGAGTGTAEKVMAAEEVLVSASPTADAGDADTDGAADDAMAKKATLLERLRVMQGRQTG